MTEARDTFLHFLADNLNGVTFHYMVRTASDPTSDTFRMNAVNVQFLNAVYGRNSQQLQAAIDVIYDDEETANDTVAAIWELLSSAFYTPLLDYSTPDAPLEVGKNLSWSFGPIEFRKIIQNNYTHLHCVVTLMFS